MILAPEIQEMVRSASSKALATTNGTVLNVVPVSEVRVSDDEIVLFNFFMKKTKDNVISHPGVSLVCWHGISGVQIKGVVTYLEDGERFDLYRTELLEKFPERILYGVLVITPEEVCDISLP